MEKNVNYFYGQFVQAWFSEPKLPEAWKLGKIWQTPQGGDPYLAKLANITPVSMVFVGDIIHDISIYLMGLKNQRNIHITGDAPPCTTNKCVY